MSKCRWSHHGIFILVSLACSRGPGMRFCTGVRRRQHCHATKSHEIALPRNHRQGRSRQHLTQGLWSLVVARRPSATNSGKKVRNENTTPAHPVLEKRSNAATMEKTGGRSQFNGNLASTGKAIPGRIIHVTYRVLHPAVQDWPAHDQQASKPLARGGRIDLRSGGPQNAQTEKGKV